MLFSAVACQKDIPVEYTIYYTANDELDDKSVQQELSAISTKYKYKNASQLDFLGLGEEFIDTEASEFYEIEINGETIVGKFSESYKIGSENANDLKQAYFDVHHRYVYCDENGNWCAEFKIKKSTGELVFYNDARGRDSSGNCSAEDAKIISDKFINGRYNDKYTNEYVYSKTEVNTGRNNSPQYVYQVIYERKLYGYVVDEIVIQINKAGDIVGIGASDIGKYYKIEERISQKAIEQAYKTLMEFRGIKNVEMTPETIRLKIAGDGKLYLKSMYEVSNDISARIINVE